MNIELTDQEAVWLHALLLVHEGELSDSILEKLVATLEMARETWHTKAQSNLYNPTKGVPATGASKGNH